MKYCAFFVSPDAKPVLMTVQVAKKSSVESVLPMILGYSTTNIHKNSECVIFSDGGDSVKNGFANYINQLYSTDDSVSGNIHGRVIIVNRSEDAITPHFADNGKHIQLAYKNYCNLTKSFSDRRRQEGPKRNKKPYDFFCKYYHSTQKGGLFHEINVQARLRWNAMSDDEKQPYNASADEDRKRYETENQQYLKENPLPPKKNSSAYNMYCKETKVKSKKGDDVDKSKPWKSLTEDEKQYYQVLADKD